MPLDVNPKHEAHYALTRAQTGLWLAQQMDAANPCYWTAEALLLDGALNLSLFMQAVRQTLTECSSLHARFSLDGDTLQQHFAQPSPELVAELDFCATPDPMASAQAWIQHDLVQAVDLQHGPLFASAVIKLGAQDLGTQRHLWYVRVHHIALDGFGYSLLFARAAELYRALCQESLLPFAAKDIHTVIQEDEAYHASAAYGRDQEFFLQKMAPFVATRKPASVLATPLHRVAGELTEPDFQQLQTLARQFSVEWHAALVATLALCWHHITGEKAFVFGLPVMNRLGSSALQIPCMAMNIVPLCIALDLQMTWSALAQQIALEMRNTRQHQRYRHEDLLAALQQQSSTPQLFDAVVNLMPFQSAPVFAGAQTHLMPIASGPVPSLAFSIALQASGKGLRLDLEANPNRYSIADLQYAQRELHAIFEALIAAPINAPLCTLLPSAPLALLHGPALAPARDVLSLFMEQVQKQPEHIALQFGTQSLSYRDLHAQVETLAHALQQRGIMRNSRVALLLTRQPHSICAMLAILFLEAAYLPLDPHGPQQRRDSILQEIQADLILHEGGTSTLAPECQSRLANIHDLLCPSSAGTPPASEAVAKLILAQNHANLHPVASRPRSGREGGVRASCAKSSHLQRKNGFFLLNQADGKPSAPSPCPLPQAGEGMYYPFATALSSVADKSNDTLAYLIYTSGSTGKPNGVMISRSALAHFVSAAQQRYRIHTQDRVLQFAPLHFDASVEEIYLSLCHGATLVLRDDAMLESAQHFLQECSRHGISVLDLPTAFWHELVFSMSTMRLPFPASVRLLIIGGEAVQTERLARWHSLDLSHVQLFNTYGPTEATVICSAAMLSNADLVKLSSSQPPLGLALPGLTLALCALEAGEMRPLAQRVGGVTGELCIIGPSLALGYWQRPQIEAARFITMHGLREPVRAYRSGDRMHLACDGQLTFLGRVDDEVKISGHRVDPLEVEAAMLGHALAREVAVISAQSSSNSATLSAYFSASAEISAQAWRQFLAPRLPAAAIPSQFHALPNLPRNANGKIDKQALRAMPQDVHAQSNIQSNIQSDSTPARAPNAREQQMLQLWCQILGQNDLTLESDFFAAGGRSLQAIQLANRLSALLQQAVAVSMLYRYPSVALLADALATADSAIPSASDDMFASMLTLQRTSSARANLFCLPPAEGFAWCYFGLSRFLPHINLYGLQAPGVMHDADDASFSLSAAIQRYLQLIRAQQPHGPYYLLGWSAGGGIAQMLATQLQAEGETVALLALLDAYPSNYWQNTPPALPLHGWQALLDILGAPYEDEAGATLSIAQIEEYLRQADSPLATLAPQHLQRIADNAWHTLAQYRELQHASFAGRVLFVEAMQKNEYAPQWQTWLPYLPNATTNFHHFAVDSSHANLCQMQALAHIGPRLADELGQIINQEH